MIEKTTQATQISYSNITFIRIMYRPIHIYIMQHLSLNLLDHFVTTCYERLSLYYNFFFISARLKSTCVHIHRPACIPCMYSCIPVSVFSIRKSFDISDKTIYIVNGIIFQFPTKLKKIRVRIDNGNFANFYERVFVVARTI